MDRGQPGGHHATPARCRDHVEHDQPVGETVSRHRMRWPDRVTDGQERPVRVTRVGRRKMRAIMSRKSGKDATSGTRSDRARVVLYR